MNYAAFCSYAYPAAGGFARARVQSDAAAWSEALGEFLLPYDGMSIADDPESELMRF